MTENGKIKSKLLAKFDPKKSLRYKADVSLTNAEMAILISLLNDAEVIRLEALAARQS